MSESQPQHPRSVPRNMLLRIAYDGTDFFGWQIQPRRPTIQGTLADAFLRLTGEQVELFGSGRTDAGVHACAQTASVKIFSPIPCPNLLKALNRLLPESIRVLSIQQVPGTFHARYDASSKIYRYRMYRGPICPPALARYVFPYPYRLDEAAMQAGAAMFEGALDFRSFAASDDLDEPRDDSADGVGCGDAREPKSYVRTIFSSEMAKQGDELVYTVRGSGFLRHMVRNIVGTLIDVGRGRIAPRRIAEILAARSRSAAGPTAPGRGLHLVSVFYPPEAFAAFPEAYPAFDGAGLDNQGDPAKIDSRSGRAPGRQEDRE